MKTLKQWYTELSDPAKKWIKKNCSAWFDENESDCYRKIHKQTPDEAIESILLNMPDRCSYFGSDDRERVIDMALRALYSCGASNVDKLLDKMKKVYNEYLPENFHIYYDKSKQEEIFKELHGRNTYYDDTETKFYLSDYLYSIKDFSNIEIDFSKIRLQSQDSEPVVEEIIGRENFKHIINENLLNFVENIRRREPNQMFDELFFCENGWNDEQKRKVLRHRYCKNDDLTMIEDFFERIVSVDHSYLRFIYNIISSNTSLAMKIYNQKKPEFELKGNETIPQLYRYPKEIRKLVRIAHVCALENVSKVNAGYFKEIAPLIKIYGYNFNDIYNALYPEDAECTVM